jgi:hypothetical protein
MFIRFTKNNNETNFKSEDQVNKVMFNGVCAYDISEAVSELINEDYTLEEAVQICAKKQAEHDNWHAHNTNGHYVIFDGEFVEYERDNQDFKGNRAVIAKIKSYVGFGRVEQTQYGYKVDSFQQA